MSRAFRRRSPAAREELFIYEDLHATGCRKARRIGREQGEKLVMAGNALPVNDTNGKHVGYELVERKPINNGLVAAKPVPVVITAREMELVAGQKFKHGKSVTAGMKETERVTRVHPVTRKPLPAEDEIERAVAKLAAWEPVRLCRVVVSE